MRKQFGAVCRTGCRAGSVACRRKRLSVSILLLSLFLFGACEKRPQALPEIRFGHAPHDHHSALYIAASNADYFRQNGGVYLKERIAKKEYDLMEGEKPIARMTINASLGGKELVRKLDENIFDMSYGGVPAILSFIDKGSSLHILAPANSEGAAFVVRKDLNVKGWQDFVRLVQTRKTPLRIGYKVAVSVQNIIFEAALKAENISFSPKLDDPHAKLIVVNMHGAKNLIPAMNDGIIDGFVIMQPFVAKAEESGAGQVVSYLEDLPPAGQWKGNPCCALAGRDLFVQNYPHVVQVLTSLLMRANHLIGQNPQKSAGQVAQWLGNPTEVEMQSIPTITFLSQYTEDWHRGVQYWVTTMVQAGRLSAKVKNAYETGGLEPVVYDMETYTQAVELSPDL